MKNQLGIVLCMAFVFVGGLQAADQYGLSSPHVQAVGWNKVKAQPFRLEFRVGVNEGSWVLVLPGGDTYLTGGGDHETLLRVGEFHDCSALSVTDDPATVQSMLRRQLLAANDAGQYTAMLGVHPDWVGFWDGMDGMHGFVERLAAIVGEGEVEAGSSQGVALMELVHLLDAEAKALSEARKTVSNAPGRDSFFGGSTEENKR